MDPSVVQAYAAGVAVDAIRSAYEALGEGDVEPLVALPGASSDR